MPRCARSPSSTVSTCATVPSSRRPAASANHLRLSYAFYDDDDIAEGVARLGRALHSAD